MIEPYYDKVVDFALEFVCSATEVRFLGISVFETNERNAYVGNYIAAQEVLWERIRKLVPRFDFELLIEVVREELALRFVGHYLGPLGVDMMVVRTPLKEGEGSRGSTHPLPALPPLSRTPHPPSGTSPNLGAETKELLVHPCVEVNVRRTMGELSLHMVPLLAEGAEGFFRIVYDKEAGGLQRAVAAMPPAVYDDNGKLVSGTMLLTPLTDDTHYVAVVEIR